jgi:FOG: Ankyrin repeat
MTRLPLLLSVLLLACFSARAQPQDITQKAEINYQTGIKLLQEGSAAEALPFLEAAVRARSDSYLYRLNAGRAAQFSGNFRSCVSNLTEALRLRPSEQTAQVFHLWRGECYAELGDRVSAASDFVKAVELQPGLKFAYGTRIFYDTGNTCRGNADANYREAESFYNSNKIYEAYRHLYVALKCDAYHLPSLKLRLKIESADDNLATHAKFHRVDLAKIETSIAKRSNTKGEEDDPNSDDFLDKVFDVNKPITVGRDGKGSSTPLLNKYWTQIESWSSGRPGLTQTMPKQQGVSKSGSSIFGAVYAGNTPLALDLISRGENPNYHTTTDLGFRRSVLFEAIERKHLIIAKALLEAGANPNCNIQLKEMCPMAPAISQGNSLAVALLIRYKVDVDGLYNSDPTTYLMAAAVFENKELFDLLVEAGANRSAKNKKGETADDIFERKVREAAAKVPPTEDELRLNDLKMLMLRRRGISSITTKFNAHMEFYKKVNGGTLTSNKIENLTKAIAYLDEIITYSREVELSAARQLTNTGYDSIQRETIRAAAADAAKSSLDARKLKIPLEEKLSGLRKGFQ